MKQILTFLLICLIAISFSCCGPALLFTSTLKPHEIDSVLILPPLASVDLITRGNTGAYHRENSSRVMQYLAESIDAHLPKHISKQFLDVDSTEQLQMFDAMYDLVSRIEQKGDIKGVAVSPSLLETLDKNNCNYAVGTYCYGFSRAKGNFGKEVLKSIGIGLLTLGTVIPSPEKSACTTQCFIIDRKHKNIAFYRKDITAEDPTNFTTIKNQVGRIIENYFAMENRSISYKD